MQSGQGQNRNGTNGHAIAGLDWVRRQRRPPLPSQPICNLTLADLFCGCGGLSLGAWEGARSRRRALDIRLAIDNAPMPVDVYKSNFAVAKENVHCAVIESVFDGALGRRATSNEINWATRIGPIDLLVAGPPCQGHSDLNNSTRRNDPRNSLYLKVVRAAEILRPKVVVIENVPTVQHDMGQVVTTAVRCLGVLEFEVSEAVVQLAEFGIPQRRKRHFLVATAKEIEFKFSMLDSLRGMSRTVGEFLAGLENEPASRDGAFYQPASSNDENKRRIKYLFDHKVHDLPDEERPSCHRDKEHAYVSMYGRIHWDKPAQTLTSGFGSMGQGRYVHPKRKRLLTPHEAARLQGFPDFFDFSSVERVTALREMIANAVPPQFIAALVAKLIDLGAF
jgi:DNA (cytosine-5)-methyltransferase 1